MRQQKSKVTTVSIPKSLARHIKERIKGTSFRSVSAFVIHLLQEIETEIETLEQEGKESVHKAKED